MPRSAPATSVVDQLQPLGVDQVRFGQYDYSCRDLQQIHDGQVLAGLGHHTFVCGDDKHDGVQSSDPGQHVLDEVAVARHIHDAHRLPIGQGQPGEAQIDGHLALALFF